MATQKRVQLTKLANIPTWKINEILNSPNCTGIDGRDYGPVKEDLERIIRVREQGEAIRAKLKWERDFIAYEDSLDEILPPLPRVLTDFGPDLLWLDNGAIMEIPPMIESENYSEIPF